MRAPPEIMPVMTVIADDMKTWGDGGPMTPERSNFLFMQLSSKLITFFDEHYNGTVRLPGITTPWKGDK